jgi:hypothetical protein
VHGGTGLTLKKYVSITEGLIAAIEQWPLLTYKISSWKLREWAGTCRLWSHQSCRKDKMMQRDSNLRTRHGHSRSGSRSRSRSCSQPFSCLFVASNLRVGGCIMLPLTFNPCYTPTEMGATAEGGLLHSTFGSMILCFVVCWTWPR